MMTHGMSQPIAHYLAHLLPSLIQTTILLAVGGTLVGNAVMGRGVCR